MQKILLRLFLVILTTIFSLSATEAFPQTNPRLLIQPKAGLSRNYIDKILHHLEYQHLGTIHAIHTHIIEIKNDSARQKLVVALQKNPLIESVESDELALPVALPSDPYFSSQWHLGKILAPDAWSLSQGKDVIVAVIDTGVDSDHPDLIDKLIPGWNFFDNNADTADVYGHGTSVAGTVAATTDNGIGVSSVARDSLIMPVRISSPEGSASFSTIAQAIIWATDNGADIINISFGPLASSSTIKSASDYAQSQGSLVVISAGNDSTYSNITNHPTEIFVSATDRYDSITSWSNYGEYIDLAAPGLSIYTTADGGGYRSVSGTSFSSPIVAAVAALILSANPVLYVDELKTILFDSADDYGDYGYDIYYGHGRINAYKAVLAASEISTPPDNEPPAVSIINPTSGSVSQIVSIDVSASDNINVTHVDLYINDALAGSRTTSPFNFSWDTTSYDNGPATLLAKAYDSAQNEGTSEVVTLDIANTIITDTIPPSIEILSPTDNDNVSQSVTISATANDDSGILDMLLLIDGKMVYQTLGSTLNYTWRLRKVSLGTHTISITAQDHYENTSSATINVNVTQDTTSGGKGGSNKNR